MAHEKFFTALGEITKRVPWRSEAEERWVTNLLHETEQDWRTGETLEDGRSFSSVIPAPPVDAPTIGAPVQPGQTPIDYDLLAQAIVRAQQRGNTPTAPQVAPPPAPAGAVTADPSWQPPASPDIPPVSVHAGAAAAEADPAAAEADPAAAEADQAG